MEEHAVMATPGRGVRLADPVLLIGGTPPEAKRQGSLVLYFILLSPQGLDQSGKCGERIWSAKQKALGTCALDSACG